MFAFFLFWTKNTFFGKSGPEKSKQIVLDESWWLD